MLSENIYSLENDNQINGFNVTFEVTEKTQSIYDDYFYYMFNEIETDTKEDLEDKIELCNEEIQEAEKTGNKN